MLTTNSRRDNEHRVLRVLIVDDHPIERAGIWAVVSWLSGFEVCGIAKHFEEGLALIDELAPDVVSLDLHSGVDDQTRCIEAIHQEHPDVPIMVVGVEDEQPHQDRWLKAGATNFVRKDDSVSQFVEGLFEAAKVRGRSTPQDGDGRGTVDQWVNWPECNGLPLHLLSSRELEVFDVLGSGVTTKEAADSLNISEKTVERHRESIKFKLSIDSFTQFMRHAVEWHLFRTQPDKRVD